MCIILLSFLFAEGRQVAALCGFNWWLSALSGAVALKHNYAAGLALGGGVRARVLKGSVHCQHTFVYTSLAIEDDLSSLLTGNLLVSRACMLENRIGSFTCHRAGRNDPAIVEIDVFSALAHDLSPAYVSEGCIGGKFTCLELLLRGEQFITGAGYFCAGCIKVRLRRK
jgi:hypothetical protein